MKTTILAMGLVLALTWQVFAHGDVLIDFDDLPNATPATNQYEDQGVIFTGFRGLTESAPEIRNQQFVSVPFSPPNYLTNFINWPSTSSANRLTEIRMLFTAPTSDVSMIVNTAGAADITFDVYDFSGALQSTQIASGTGTDNFLFEITGSNIGRISAFTPIPEWWWSLDNLSYSQIPEPLSCGFLGAVVIGLIARHRRRG